MDQNDDWRPRTKDAARQQLTSLGIPTTTQDELIAQWKRDRGDVEDAPSPEDYWDGLLQAAGSSGKRRVFPEAFPVRFGPPPGWSW